MIEQTKLSTVRKPTITSLPTVNTSQIVNTTHLADYSTVTTKSVEVDFSDQYDNLLYITGMIHCFTYFVS